MNNINKQTLIRDLCARLPYGVKVHINFPREKVYTLSSIQKDTFTEGFKCGFKEYPQSTCIDERVQPYLFPISSMTEEQKEELQNVDICGNIHFKVPKGYRANDNIQIDIKDISKYLDWLNAHHFDYRGLIEKGLAIDATNLNLY